jgi:ATP-binding cassette subfamily F protein uup
LGEGFSAFEAWRDAVLAQEADEQHKLGRKIAMEEEWLRYGVTARRTRNQRRLAELHELRRKRREHRGATGTAGLKAAQADLSGRLVAAAEGISTAYGDHLLVRNFSVRVMRGDRGPCTPVRSASSPSAAASRQAISTRRSSMPKRSTATGTF